MGDCGRRGSEEKVSDTQDKQDTLVTGNSDGSPAVPQGEQCGSAVLEEIFPTLVPETEAETLEGATIVRGDADTGGGAKHYALTSTSASASTSTTTTTTTPTLQPPQLTLGPITTPVHVASLKRLNSVILPVSYPDSLYRELLTDGDARGVSRLAWWNGLCIGGVRGKVEDVNPDPGPDSGGDHREAKRKVKVYLMTMGVLSPFRRVGVGGALLEWLRNGGDGKGKEGSAPWDVVEVYAHVWEANSDALEWYARRGFTVDREMVKGYYRKLRPNGARVVRWTALEK